MPKSGRRWLIAVCLSIAVLAVLLLYLDFGRRPAVVADSLPERLSDNEFWRMVTDFSEPGGYFPSDNFLSNEISYQEIIPVLRKTVSTGGAYIGVGPEQNFTYIVALAPKMVFIVDIRRQNLLEHLLYKSFMELSEDRAAFISRLFARPRPPGLDKASSVETLFDAFDAVEGDRALFEGNLRETLDHLVKTHGFDLSEEDENGIQYVYRAFFEAGPGLSYTFLSQRPRGAPSALMPTYEELMKATDGTEAGKNWGFLATDDQFRIVQQLQKNNLIIPLVGDFAGQRTIRAAGQYLNERRAVVSAFYTSNVEQYLFRQADDWRLFYGNVGALPVDSSSVFIRAVLNRPMPLFSLGVGGGWSRTTWSPISDTLKAFENRKITSYSDVVGMSRLP